MIAEEHKKYLETIKSNLTEKERISLVKEYNKLPKSAKYWWNRVHSCNGISEESYLLLKYCEKRYNYATDRMEDLEYILDIPEEYTFRYKLLNS